MTTATPTAPPTILAIDLGRSKSVACVYDRATRVNRSSRQMDCSACHPGIPLTSTT